MYTAGKFLKHTDFQLREGPHILKEKKKKDGERYGKRER